MVAKLTPGAWAAWGDLLQRWLSLMELRQLAFDLGVGFEVFSAPTKQSCALALVRSVEHADQLGCLAAELNRLVPGVSLPPLPDPSPCVRRRLAAVLFPVDWPSVSMSGLQRDLADACHVPVEQVAWVAAAGDQVRLLISLPGDAPALPPADALGRGRYGLGVISAWDRLSRAERRKWRLLACRWQPTVEGDRLCPAISWAAIRTAIRSRDAWLAAIVGMLLVIGGAWARRRLAPWASSLWRRSPLIGSPIAREAALWGQFLGSLALSALALSWLTALWFSLGTLVLYGVSRLPRLRPSIRDWSRRHDRLVGTVLGLLASAGALALLPQVARRPLDYWDLGVQVLLAAVIELVVLGVFPR
jgi:Effector-associated domain 7